MYKIEDITRTYGQAADILNRCDDEDIPIYVQLKHARGTVNVPLDNFEYFRELTGHDPDDIFPLTFVEDDGDIFLRDGSWCWIENNTVN